MNNTSFQTALVKAARENGVDVDKLRADHNMMMICIDLYYSGGLDGIHRFNKTMEEKKHENVAVPPVSPSPV